MTDLHRHYDWTRPHIADAAPHIFGHPSEVVDDPHLCAAEKRTILASWASDAHAVPHLPTLRQLPDGAIVRLEEILDALKALDACEAGAAIPESDATLWQRAFNRRRGIAWRAASRAGRKPGGDDDPPPCPAAVVRPRGGGGGAFAIAEPIFA